LQRDKAELEARNAKLTSDLEHLQGKLTLLKNTPNAPPIPDDLEGRNKLLARLDADNTELREEVARLAVEVARLNAELDKIRRREASSAAAGKGKRTCLRK
jgi:uncharacterized small protein (DUF1192 family)